MRRFLIVFALALAYLLLCSKACDDNVQENEKMEQDKVIAVRDSIRDEFEADYLSEGSLYALEATARQKLSDFADYMQMMADTTLDNSFKEKAGDMIKKMFISENVRLRFILEQGRKEKKLTVKELLADGLRTPYASARFIFDSVEVQEPLQRINTGTFSGRLSFSQKFTGYSLHDTLTTNSVRTRIDVFVTKVDKIFGDDTLSVWGVFLGDMK
ncbi:MAG: hypothetical protein NT175_10670 [Bacteroidetes bacterium]|nr:hypothetical protein [Bacteroidota bacterium]